MESIFSAKGRIRRRAYLVRSLGLSLAMFLSYALACCPLVATSKWAALIRLGLFVVFCGLIVVSITQTIRRIHDINLPGWCWLIYMLPGVSYLFSCGVTLIDGTAGPNRFGPDPKGRPSYDPFPQKGPVMLAS